MTPFSPSFDPSCVIRPSVPSLLILTSLTVRVSMVRELVRWGFAGSLMSQVFKVFPTSSFPGEPRDPHVAVYAAVPWTHRSEVNRSNTSPRPTMENEPDSARAVTVTCTVSALEPSPAMTSVGTRGRIPRTSRRSR